MTDMFRQKLVERIFHGISKNEKKKRKIEYII